MKGWSACLLVLALAGCGGGGKKITAPLAGPAPTPAKDAAPWPAPADPMKLAEKAGLTPETHEFLLLHVHAHLDVFVNGRPVTVPAGIGIAIHDQHVFNLLTTDLRTWMQYRETLDDVGEFAHVARPRVIPQKL